jgi:Protein of unknown function (DUF3551)
MRSLLIIMTAAPLLLLATGDVAHAQNYPWCAQYGWRDGGRNCGFTTWQQCMATVSGIGGYCEHNAMYRAQDSSGPPRKSRRPRR